MWFFKLLFLLALIASWIPYESQAADTDHADTFISIDFEGEEEQEEEESEELAARF